MGHKPAEQIPVLLLEDLSNNSYVWNNSSKLVQKVLLVTSTVVVVVVAVAVAVAFFTDLTIIIASYFQLCVLLLHIYRS